MKSIFFDIESLENVFSLVSFNDYENTCDIYYLVDNEDQLFVTDHLLTHDELFPLVDDMVHKKNKNFNGQCRLYNLKDPMANARLAATFGLSDAQSVSDPSSKSSYSANFRLKCDTDLDYNEDEDYYIFGYNSYHYDTTMLSMYFYDAIPTTKNPVFRPIKAKLMRQYNDELFSAEFKEAMENRLRFSYKNPMYPNKGYNQMDYNDPKAVIRKNMLMTGRHLDAGRLNEKQQKVALKRILGQIGYQILESDKLRPGQNVIETLVQFLELMAYNVSDCVNLKKLVNHKDYMSAFTLKRQLLKDYPELIYNQKNDAYAPDISPKSVRRDRLMIDSSSAQLSTKALCPYGHLRDYPTVSFMYPSEAKAAAFGIPRINVLEEAKEFFYKNFSQQEIRARFDEIYNYYKSIEGKNFNTSKNYMNDYGSEEEGLPEDLVPYSLSDIPVPNTCMPYYDKDGTPSRCFVNFSTGGIHGAEYNKELYEADLAIYNTKYQEWQHQLDVINKVKTMYPDPRDLKRAKSVIIDDVKYTPSKFLMPRATVDEAYWKNDPKPPKKPELFVKSSSSDSYNIAKRYTFTSAAKTNHEDFTSYYPNMLRMMDAFFNEGLGYDRYGEIFDNKTRFGVMMKDSKFTQQERDMYSTMRNGTKLVLNSASGAADANFESNIRMNNKIISMRIIGQLFTWRIGQAQTIEGANMISTNTDGLYSVLEETKNNAVLKRESDSIHVEIEPEPLYLISKDSNNRLEVTIDDNNQLDKIIGASGGTLSCRKGPSPSKALAHPAVIDWALAEYLILAATNYKGISMSSEFDDNIGMNILNAAKTAFGSKVETLLMFQNVIASAPGSQRFVFATTDDDPNTPIPLQHYNRCFIVKDKTPGTYHLKIASAKIITDMMLSKRTRDNQSMRQNDPMASYILKVNGIRADKLPMNKEATVTKIPKIGEHWYIKICNDDLYMLDDARMDQILDALDIDKYLSLVKDVFNENWRNVVPDNDPCREPDPDFTLTV